MANKVSWTVEFKDKFSRVSRKLNQSMRGVRKSAVQTERQFRKTNKTLEKTAKKFKSIGDKAKKASLVIALPALLIGRSMVNAASDAEEMEGKFGTVFGKVKEKAQAVAESFSKDMGVAVGTSKHMLAQTGDLMTGFGFTSDAALDISNRVNVLSQELVAFSNIEGGTEAATNLLVSGLTGESQALKGLGIVVSQNDPIFKQRLKRIRATTGMTHAQARAEVTLQMAYEQSKNAIGATAREWDNYASVARRNTEVVKELKVAFGKILLPVVTQLAKGLNWVLRVLRDLPGPVKDFLVVFSTVAAVLGPLTLVVWGLNFALAFLTWPILLIVAAIALVITMFVTWQKRGAQIVAALIDIFTHFKHTICGFFSDVGDFFVDIFEFRLVNAGKRAVNFLIGILNSLLTPLDFVFSALGITDAGDLQLPTLNVNVDQALLDKRQAMSAPVKGSFGRIDGNITVKAGANTEVVNTETTTKGTNMNIGMIMGAPA